MPAKIEKPCYVIVSSPPDFESLSENQLRQDLEKGDEKTKYECMKNVIIQMQNGEKFPSLLMTIIRFVMPVQNNMIKKLLMIFWEMVNKHSPDGKLLQEMILVCDAYRRDLTHPNEFVRGATLRFLCRLQEPEIIEPLIPPIRSCLDHRLPYVRRNAVVAVHTIYQNYPHLIIDAPELILSFLESEQDNSCRRNAFMLLLRIDQQSALDYIERRLDQISTFNDTLQLVIVELIHQYCLSNPEEKNRFISVLHSLMSSGSTSVRFESAGTLMSLSSGTSIKLAAQCYIDIGLNESDNNIKLVVLDRLSSINDKFADQNILQDMAVDIFKIMDSPDIDVAEKTIELVMELVTIRNLVEIMHISRRNLTKSNASVEKSISQRKRQLIVTMLHKCTIKYPDMSKECTLMLLDLLPQFQELSASAVLNFVKMTMIQYNDNVREELLKKVVECFLFLDIPVVIREALWLIAEFSHTEEELLCAFQLLKDSLGDLWKTGDNDEAAQESIKVSTAPKLNEDGSYATQSAYLLNTPATYRGNMPTIQKILTDINPNISLAVALATAACKIVLRLKEFSDHYQSKSDAIKLCEVLVGIGGCPDDQKSLMNHDEHDRIRLCCNLLMEYNPKIAKIFESCNHKALKALMEIERRKEQLDMDAMSSSKMKSAEVDEAVQFSFLNSQSSDSRTDHLAQIDWLEVAIHGEGNDDQLKQFDEESIGQLSRIHQLSGLSDSVYAECIMNVSNFVISLDILLVNRTPETLQNVTVEIATLGDLKVVERPLPFTMSPGDFSSVTAHIKVNSTENAVIHGNIVFDLSNGQSECVVLNELKIDVLDYIKADQKMTQEQFRNLWVKFEWENKITVSTNCDELHRYVEQLCEATSMNALRIPNEELVESQAGFLSTNIYGQSVFREDILANVSIEKMENETLAGHVRIRAKTQGMAISMGRKMNVSQQTFT